MEANVNSHLQGDEEPGVLGRAPNPRFTLFWAGCQILGLELHPPEHCCLQGFNHIGTPEAPQKVNIANFWSHRVIYTSVWSKNWSPSGTM